MLVLVALLSSLISCAVVRARRGAPEHSGFLRDYSQLAPREGIAEAEIYLDPDAAWTRYDSIEIDSVTLWVTERDPDVSDEERQMLTDTMYRALHEALGRQFEIVDHPGPSVLQLRAALTQAKGANVPLRTMTTLVPQLRLIASAAALPTDAASTVGTATLEVEIRDSVTDERLAAAVDARAGAKAFFTKRTFQKWGDVEAACGYWAERAAYHFVQLGVRRKPGAPEPKANPPVQF